MHQCELSSCFYHSSTCSFYFSHRHQNVRIIRTMLIAHACTHTQWSFWPIASESVRSPQSIGRGYCNHLVIFCPSIRLPVHTSICPSICVSCLCHWELVLISTSSCRASKILRIALAAIRFHFQL